MNSLLSRSNDRKSLINGLIGRKASRVVAGLAIASTLGVGFIVPQASGASTESPLIAQALTKYAAYVDTNVASLVSSSKNLCTAINSGSLSAAKVAYPKARIYYERIEPAAGKWPTLDTDIDGRWENPVTVMSQFIGFHRIEKDLWAGQTLKGTAALCSALVAHEEQLLAFVKKTNYTSLVVAGGATDLMNESATAKVSGEEERYSKTTMDVIQANVVGANEVVSIFTPYVKTKNAALLKTLASRHAAVVKAVAALAVSPGYDDTGFANYSSVSAAARRQLSVVLNAYAESLSQLTGIVG